MNALSFPPTGALGTQVSSLFQRASPALAGFLVLFCTGTCRAGNFEILHDFTGAGGERPYGSVVGGPGGALFGTTAYGGSADYGTVYRLAPDGSSFTVLHDFTKAADGIRVYNSLAVVGNALYGVAFAGGAHNGGTLFQVDATGGTFQVAHNFAGPLGLGDGAAPYSAPTVAGQRLYGMTYGGGANGLGTVYTFDTASGSYNVLHSFAAGEGTKPFGTVTVVGGWLYGMTSDHLSATSAGTIFRMKQDGSDFEVIHQFAGGAQGGYPYDSLTYDGKGALYGTTLGFYTDTSDEGVIFKYDLSAGQYQVLHDFGATAGDGAKPNGNVVLGAGGNVIYGVAHGSEIWGGLESGTLFQLQSDGSGFEVLHEFSGLDEGDTPMRTPWLSDSQLYGTSAYGGAPQSDQPRGYGTVWAMAIPEPPAHWLIALVAGGVIVRRVWVRRLLN